MSNSPQILTKYSLISFLSGIADDDPGNASLYHNLNSLFSSFTAAPPPSKVVSRSTKAAASFPATQITSTTNTTKTTIPSQGTNPVLPASTSVPRTTPAVRVNSSSQTAVTRTV